MASPEPGRNSSSPSASITDIRREGADGSALRVRFDDGSFFFVDAGSPLVAELPDSGPLDEDRRSRLEQADEAFRCRRKALELLARSEQCRRGLEAKLRRKQFSGGSVAAALDRLEEAGSLDDRRFAEAWVRSRLRRRPEGAAKLRGALMSKGIASSVATEAVNRVLRDIGDPDSSAALERALAKLRRRSGMDAEKLTAAMARRGFPPSAVRRALRRAEGEDS